MGAYAARFLSDDQDCGGKVWVVDRDWNDQNTSAVYADACRVGVYAITANRCGARHRGVG